MSMGKTGVNRKGCGWVFNVLIGPVVTISHLDSCFVVPFGVQKFIGDPLRTWVIVLQQERVGDLR